MTLMPIDLSAPDNLAASSIPSLRLSGASLRILLFAAAFASALLSFHLTRGEAASRAAAAAGADLTRVLQFMALFKSTLGVGALALVSIRFRFPIALRLALAYIAGGALMAAGPAMMWTMVHVGAGALLFYAGIGALLIVAWMDEGARWRFARGPARLDRPI